MEGCFTACIRAGERQGWEIHVSGLHPSSVIRGKGMMAEAVDSDNGRVTSYDERPLEAVRSWMSGFKAPRLPDSPKWTGGCVGFWSYDVIRTIERLPNQAADDLGLPDYLFLRMDELWIIDHQEKTLYCVSTFLHKGWVFGGSASRSI